MSVLSHTQDLDVVLPELIANLDANKAVTNSSGVAPQPIPVLPLRWGDADSAARVLESMGSSAGQPVCDLIVAADVVYHEHLIDPFIATLITLTDPEHGLTVSGPKRAPPLIVISYVQRFKRAKVFLKKVRKLFHVEVVPVADVVDYDVLNWNRGTARLSVCSNSADWHLFAARAALSAEADSVVEAVADAPVACLAYHYLLKRK